MNIKKLVLSLSIITTVGAAGILGTQALLSDNASLTTNTFSTGTADLQIARDDTSYLGTVSGFSGTLNPGETKTYFFWLKNNASGFDMDLAVQATGVTGSLDPTKVKVKFVPVQDAGNVADTETPSGPASLSTLTTVTPIQADNQLSTNEYQRYRLEVSLDSSVSTSGNVAFDLVFTGSQVAPTP